jgi:hypothetical protein
VEEEQPDMAGTTASTSWYLLVFAALGFFVTTFAAIVSHIPRVPQQRGLLLVMLVSAVASLLTLALTQLEASKTGFDIFRAVLVLVVAAALLDLFYFVQARRRRLDGAGWSFVVALLLLGCTALGFMSQFGTFR